MFFIKILEETTPIWKTIVAAGLTAFVTTFATKSAEKLFSESDEKDLDEDEPVSTI